MEFRAIPKNSERLQKKQMFPHLLFVSVKNDSCNIQGGLHFIAGNCSTAEFIFLLKPQQGQNGMCVSSKKIFRAWNQAFISASVSPAACVPWSLLQWFSAGVVIFSPREYLAMSGDTWGEVLLLSTQPYPGQPSTGRIIQPQMLTVLLLRNPALLGRFFFHPLHLASSS